MFQQDNAPFHPGQAAQIGSTSIVENCNEWCGCTLAQRKAFIGVVYYAKVGTKQSSDTKVGKCGFGKINKRGEKLVEFSEANRLHFQYIFEEAAQEEVDMERPK